jgi:UDP-N-acetylglucosamine--N-acetylmuramyl-(pentapeptide) pyrophosphoryl-undecaprenol N-acetylglucosamine transferase
VHHAAGRGGDTAVLERYVAAGVEDARVDAFIDDMASAYGAADLVITRAGATTIAELTALGVPALFVPFPFAADDHQTSNAMAVVERGGGVMVSDDEYLQGDRAARILTPLLHHREVLQRMAAASRALGRPDAADDIARHLLATLGAST